MLYVSVISIRTILELSTVFSAFSVFFINLILGYISAFFCISSSKFTVFAQKISQWADLWKVFQMIYWHCKTTYIVHSTFLRTKHSTFIYVPKNVIFQFSNYRVFDYRFSYPNLIWTLWFLIFGPHLLFFHFSFWFDIHRTVFYNKHFKKF